MPKRPRTAKPHPVIRKPKPRAVSKAHRQEQHENKRALAEVRRSHKGR